ncbi:hypothetical protein PFISCL1PPCAC_13962, partial [Pristionchus fissidentatus]
FPFLSLHINPSLRHTTLVQSCPAATTSARAAAAALTANAASPANAPGRTPPAAPISARRTVSVTKPPSARRRARSAASKRL